jgi:hypothetical protein
VTYELRTSDDGEYAFELEWHMDGHVWHDARVKWDGCVHYVRYFNRPKAVQKETREDDHDYLHICSVADVVDEMLTILAKAKGRPNFEEWGDEERRMAKVLERHGFVSKESK